MQNEVWAGLRQATAESEAQGKMTGQADHSGGEKLMGTAVAAKVANGFQPEAEVVRELMADACGVTKSWVNSFTREEADEIQNETCMVTDVSLHDKA